MLYIHHSFVYYFFFVWMSQPRICDECHMLILQTRIFDLLNLRFIDQQNDILDQQDSESWEQITTPSEVYVSAQTFHNFQFQDEVGNLL